METEWISVKDRLPNTHSAKIRVRTQDNQEFDCFFYADQMGWTAFYGKDHLTYWWRAQNPYDPIDNVTHWLS